MPETVSAKLDLGVHINGLSRQIRGLAYRYSRNRALAEDLTQEILLRLHKNVSSYRNGIGSLQSWALRVGRNLIIDRYRARLRRLEVPITGETEQTTVNHRAPSPFERLLQQETRVIVERALGLLPFGLEQAVRLRDLDGMTYREISAKLHVPVGTVKSRINRGRKQLARLLAPHLASFSL